MKQSVLRYAVSTVRWDAEQRIAIEAKLMQNVKQPVHPDDLDADEFIETDLVTMDDVMYEEDIEMEKKRVRRNIIIAILAAAVLGVGGVAAAAAYSKRGSSHPAAESSARTERHSAETSRSESSTAEETRAFPALTLTDQTWNDLLSGVSHRYLRGGGPEWYTASEYGFYQRQNQRTGEAGLSLDVAEAGTLLFTDGATAAHAVLCARPNCLHDGNEYCTATTTAYQPSELVYYDGYLYAAASKQNSKGEYEAGYVLRYEPDGSGITELGRFAVHPQAKRTADVILHRGWLWVVYQDYSLVSETEAEDEIPVEAEKTGGYVICGCEIATGKTVEVKRAMSQTEGTAYNAPTALYADGDWLLWHDDGHYPSAHHGRICAVNLRTGEFTMPQLADLSPSFTEINCFSGGELVYTFYQYIGAAKYTETHRFDMETHADTALDFTYDCTDGTYCFDMRQETGTQPEYVCCWLDVYDKAGNLLQTAAFPMNENYFLLGVTGDSLYVLYFNTFGGANHAYPDGTNIFSYQNGTVHRGEHTIMRCEISDLVSGKFELEPVLNLYTEQFAN